LQLLALTVSFCGQLKRKKRRGRKTRRTKRRREGGRKDWGEG
jgi:hypothetical protein